MPPCSRGIAILLRRPRALATCWALLAQYWNGGGVVVAVDASLESRLQGRFGAVANCYMLIDGTAAWEDPSDSLGVVLEQLSPLMANVARGKGAVVNGGLVVAQQAKDSRPLMVPGTRASRPLVALNRCSPFKRLLDW
jgi:hypothetical protein